MKLVFASANKNKITEIKALLPGGIELLSLSDVGIDYEIPEPGKTIKENSFLKAEHVIKFLKAEGKELSVFADDSGLEVEALNNAPGVYSARYAGMPKSDDANNKKLLAELKTKGNRNARFVTIITLIINSNVYYFEGEINGIIANEPKGSTGFGYDPLFIPNNHDKTFAELGPEIKNTISHRAMAINKLISHLKIN